MKLKICFYLLAVTFGLNSVWAQQTQSATTSGELPRFEIGAQFSSLSRNGEGDRNGFGGRLTVNLNRNLAFEAESNFFPGRNYLGYRTNGRAVQALFGVKTGKRFQRFGVFGKARPGLVAYTDGKQFYEGTIQNLTFRRQTSTNFAVDLGGVLEIYASRHWLTRFDFGDTIVRLGRERVNQFVINPATQDLELRPVRLASETRHNFQFSAGIGFRF